MLLTSAPSAWNLLSSGYAQADNVHDAQLCSIADACLQTAGVVVKTTNAPAKYVVGQQHTADVYHLRAHSVGLMHYVPVLLGHAQHALQHTA